jgi:acid phosphatase (class A)
MHLTRRHSLGLLLAAAALVLVSPLRAEGTKAYLAPKTPDVLLIVPPPPAPDSQEQAVDIASVRLAMATRSETDFKLGMEETELTIFNFSRIIGEGFKPGRFPKTEAFFTKVEKETKAATNIGKDHWKRSRPYSVDPTIIPGKPEKSFTYPSGHSTRGMVFATLLAELFPSKREALLQAGRDVGWHRVVMGVHYPSDVLAGRAFGQAVARELLANPELRRDLEELRAELAPLN